MPLWLSSILFSNNLMKVYTTVHGFCYFFLLPKPQIIHTLSKLQHSWHTLVAGHLTFHGRIRIPPSSNMSLHGDIIFWLVTSMPATQHLQEVTTTGGAASHWAKWQCQVRVCVCVFPGTGRGRIQWILLQILHILIMFYGNSFGFFFVTRMTQCRYKAFREKNKKKAPAAHDDTLRENSH